MMHYESKKLYGIAVHVSVAKPQSGCACFLLKTLRSRVFAPCCWRNRLEL